MEKYGVEPPADGGEAGRAASDLDTALAVRTYAEGFKAGADLLRSRRGQVLGAGHEHWRAGYAAGRAALEHAMADYGAALKCALDHYKEG